MLTPFDWQEGVGHRAGYVEARLAQGSPVLAASAAEGVLFYTRRRKRNKVFELYDRLAFSAIGQQSDLEALRVAAVDFAHQEGYRRSEDDVTVQRVVSGLSPSLKRAFADFSLSPVVARALFVEVGNVPAEDQFFVLEFDGDYTTYEGWAFVSGEAAGEAIRETMADFVVDREAEVTERLRTAWRAGCAALNQEGSPPTDEEIVLLSRDERRVNRFLRR